VFIAPGLVCLINLTASYEVIFNSINAIATKVGALPKPATQ